MSASLRPEKLPDLASAREEQQPRGGFWAFVLGPVFALQFLTVCPPLIRRWPSRVELGASESFFPLTGLLIGWFLVVVDSGARLVLPPQAADAVIVTTLALVTGALHLDGIIDTFDGIFGGTDATSRLSIMRDPRAGSFGVVALACLLIVQVSALAALTGPLRVVALVLGPCLGRWAIVQAAWSFPYARPQGMGRAFKDAMRWPHVLVAAITALAASAMALGVPGVVLFAGTTLAVWIASGAMCRRLGGLTGDTYGAMCELAQAGVWLAVGSRLLGASQ